MRQSLRNLKWFIITAAGLMTAGIFLGACQVNETDEPGNDSPVPGETFQPDPGNNNSDDAGSDLEAIHQNWEASAHADTFILDEDGNNTSCARCHSPADWFPTLEEIPESCFVCKFEVSDPPPFIAETDWKNVRCNICHKLDKNKTVKPGSGYTYLENPFLGEYGEVNSTTELCQKCHFPIELPEHEVAQLGGAHADYECTKCHDAHDTATSCGAVGCHEDVLEPSEPIAGHDEAHQSVSCEACHDADGMEVGPDDEGNWTTFISVMRGEETSLYALTSHNIVLEASCERCHYSDNPWGLTSEITQP